MLKFRHSLGSRFSSMGALIAALLGAATFAAIHGLDGLAPWRHRWLLEGDAVNHYLGWLFFRNESWVFPLGRIQSILHPVGTSVTLMDSIPALAILFKALRAVLPVDFQYFGLWLYGAFALQGAVAYRLFRALEASSLHALLGALFLVVSPPFWMRVGHTALMAHWMILLVLLLYLRRAPVWAFVMLACLALATHPYLGVMVGGFAVLGCLRHGWRAAAACIAIGTAWAWLIGIFLTLEVGTAEFGSFAADLGTFFDPINWSAWFRTGRVPREGSYEGMAYFGVGGLLLVAVVSIVALARNRGRFRIPALLRAPLALAIGMFVFSLGDRVHLLGRPVLDLSGFYGPLIPYVSAFRASGRFAWPLFYFVLVLAIIGATRVAGKRWAAALIGVCLSLQASETVSSYRAMRARIASSRKPASIVVPSPFWEDLAPGARTIYLVPMVIVSANVRIHVGADIYVPAALSAARAGVAINSGSTSRLSFENAAILTENLDRGLLRQEWDRDGVYIVWDDNIPISIPCVRRGPARVCLPR